MLIHIAYKVYLTCLSLTNLRELKYAKKYAPQESRSPGLPIKSRTLYQTELAGLIIDDISRFISKIIRTPFLDKSQANTAIIILKTLIIYSLNISVHPIASVTTDTPIVAATTIFS